MNQKKLLHNIHFKDLPTEKVLIKPNSAQYRIQYILLYFFAWVISLATAHMFILYGNLFILFCSMGFVLITLMLNNQAIRAGKAKIKFI